MLQTVSGSEEGSEQKNKRYYRTPVFFIGYFPLKIRSNKDKDGILEKSLNLKKAKIARYQLEND